MLALPIRDSVDSARIDIIFSNHAEMDHSGCLPRERPCQSVIPIPFSGDPS